MKKIYYYGFELPFLVIRNISIPPSTEENWSRIRATLFPIFSLFIIFLFFNIYTYKIGPVYIAIPCFVLVPFVSILIYCSSHYSRAPSYMLLYTFLSFIISIIWIWGMANLLVDILEIVGIVADLPLEFLGLTFLGFGNALPDITTNIALSRMGFS